MARGSVRENIVLSGASVLVTCVPPPAQYPLYFAGDWEASDTYWGSRDFLAWLVNDSPVAENVVFNDRWGAGDMCAHGSFFTCADRFLPNQLVPHPWENAFTLGACTATPRVSR